MIEITRADWGLYRLIVILLLFYVLLSRQGGAPGKGSHWPHQQLIQL